MTADWANMSETRATASVHAERLLGEGDGPAYSVINPDARTPFVLICDHASKRVPMALGTLGLPPEELERHIAWDIGIANVTEHLAKKFDAVAVLCGYSRLVIDCNRDPASEQSIPDSSDGVDVPGNRGLSSGAVNARVREIFDPYHMFVAELLDHKERQDNVTPAVVMMHSFTPVMDGFQRPWHVGVLWDHADGRMAQPLLQALRAHESLCVGDNEPYSAMNPAGYSMPVHASRHGRPCAQLEIRQDLIADATGTERWAQIVYEALLPIVSDQTLYRRLA